MPTSVCNDQHFGAPTDRVANCPPGHRHRRAIRVKNRLVSPMRNGEWRNVRHRAERSIAIPPKLVRRGSTPKQRDTHGNQEARGGRRHQACPRAERVRFTLLLSCSGDIQVEQQDASGPQVGCPKRTIRVLQGEGQKADGPQEGRRSPALGTTDSADNSSRGEQRCCTRCSRVRTIRTETGAHHAADTSD